jgi:hypothetical protein
MKKIYYDRAVYDKKEINAVLNVLKNISLSLIDGIKVKELEKKILTTLKYFIKLYNPCIKGKLYFILLSNLIPEIDISDGFLFILKLFKGK